MDIFSMARIWKLSLLLMATLPSSSLVSAQQAKPEKMLPSLALPALAVPSDSRSYADIADLVVPASLIVDARIRKLTKVPAAQAAGVPAHLQRTVVDAEVLALLRGTDGISGQVRFLLDIPKDSKGKLPKLVKRRFFLMGSKVAGSPGTIKLVRPDALVEWSPATDSLVRAVTREAVQIDAPQAITGIISAFHTVGTVIGEGETQIFLKTASDQPISLSVLSRPGQAKRWAVSTSEVIDESAAAPAKPGLLWYRLACGLPAQLDKSLVESGGAEEIAAAQADYRFVIASLGQCDRTRVKR
jgi:hypothetical protein